MVEELHFLPQQPENDMHIYASGGISGHNVTIVCSCDCFANGYRFSKIAI